MSFNGSIALILISIGFSLIALLTSRFLVQSRKRSRRNRLMRAIEESSAIDVGAADRSEALITYSISDRLLATRYGNWLKQTASKAGMWQEEELDGLMNRKFQFAIGSFIFISLLIQLISLPIQFLFFIPLFAFFLLDLRLLDRARSRIGEISRALPETIDLLNMCVSAGIGFHSGMQRVATTQDNPLSQEFSRVLAEMKLGQGRGPALLAMSDRLGIEPLDQFVNSILQVDRLGVPMTKVLEEQSRRLRTMRREKAREQAQKLPVKILGPTMVFMLPALLIIVLGPAVVSILRSFGQ